jgi:hypothetical protein
VSSAGKWNRWFSLLGEDPEPFGDSETYQMAADFTADCDMVEDWGCGKGWLRRFIPPHRYRGVDGSTSPFADVIADLTTYQTYEDGIVIRHVLEHEYEWRKILDNAIVSARRRLVIILFTPTNQERTRQIAYAPDPGVPDLSFFLPDLVLPAAEAGWQVMLNVVSPSPTQYGQETVLRCSR